MGWRAWEEGAARPSSLGFVAASVLPLIVASGGYSLVAVFGILLLGSTDSRACESVVVARL